MQNYRSVANTHYCTRLRTHTRFDVQRVLVDGQVHGLVGRVAEVFQDQIYRGGDTARHRLAKLHPAVHHDAPIAEIQDLQVLEVTQVGLQVGDQLWKEIE